MHKSPQSSPMITPELIEEFGEKSFNRLLLRGRLDRLEERLTRIEEGIGIAPIQLPASQDRLEALERRVQRLEEALKLSPPMQQTPASPTPEQKSRLEFPDNRQGRRAHARQLKRRG